MDLLPRGLDVVGHLGVVVRGAVEVPEHLGPVLLGLEEVVELESEPLGKLADCRVALVDQLSASLGDLAVGERASERPATAADAARRLVHVGEVPGVAERIGSTQPGKSGPDDDDLGRGGAARGRGEPAESGEPERGDAGLLDESTPRRWPLRCGRCLHRVREGSARHVQRTMHRSHRHRNVPIG